MLDSSFFSWALRSQHLPWGRIHQRMTGNLQWLLIKWTWKCCCEEMELADGTAKPSWKYQGCACYFTRFWPSFWCFSLPSTLVEHMAGSTALSHTTSWYWVWCPLSILIISSLVPHSETLLKCIWFWKQRIIVVVMENSLTGKCWWNYPLTKNCICSL